MKIINKPTLAMLFATILITACGGSGSSKKSEPSPVVETVRAEISSIKPEEVENMAKAMQAIAVKQFIRVDTTEYAFVDHEIVEGQLHMTIEAPDKRQVAFVFFNVNEEGRPLPDTDGDDITAFIANSIVELNLFIESLSSGEQAPQGIQILSGTFSEIVSEDDLYTLSSLLTDPATGGGFELSMAYGEVLFSYGSSTIEVSGEKAFINGTLGAKTYLQMKTLIQDNPQVNTLVLQKVPGSSSDEFNTYTGRLVRDAKLNTQVTKDSVVSSGGVDLFAAGQQRFVESGAKLGVHSWCCESVGDKELPANELPIDHPGHKYQINYFTEMLADSGKDFYFFTINASGFDSVHVMTPAEITLYKLATQ